jgi:hypothetical protein
MTVGDLTQAVLTRKYAWADTLPDEERKRWYVFWGKFYSYDEGLGHLFGLALQELEYNHGIGPA